MSFNLIPDNWEFLKELLSEPFDSLDELYSFLSFASGNGNLNCKGLEQLEPNSVLPIFNFIRLQALRIEEVFPEPQVIPILQEGTITLTREQVFILLCHMALLTLKPTKRHVYWVTFENWLTDGRPCAQAYLQGLIAYFNMAQVQLTNNSRNWCEEIVTFERRRLKSPVLPLSEAQVTVPSIHLTGSIGDYSRNIVDFANEYIGYGIGGTQEEILFASFIELCPAMIFCCIPMEKDEAIVIRNARKYVEYSGYGFNVKYKGLYDQIESYTVIAIDALDFSADYSEALKLQLKSESLQRELIKLIAGFSAIRNETIDTGHWGCGAFGGNKCLKAILQLIATSITGNRLSFCCFGDEGFYNSFSVFTNNLVKSEMCVSTLWSELLSIDPDVKEFTFDDLNLK